MGPLITILIANYNGERFLERAIASALAQNMPREKFEILVADDGSTDGSLKVVQQFGAEVRSLRLPHHGLPATCNDGIKAALGTYLTRLDSDDELEPTALAQTAAVLEAEHDVAVVATDRWEIDDRTKLATLVRIDPGNIYTYIAPGVMFRREALLTVGAYGAMYWEEYDLFIRILDAYGARYLPSPLYRYYRHSTSMTANIEARREGWETLIRKWGMERLRRFGHCAELEDVYAASLTA